MFDSGQLDKKKKKSNSTNDLFSRAADPQKKNGSIIPGESSSIIEDAFNPIKCTTHIPWKQNKSLLERIDEDHPSERKNTEYSLDKKNIGGEKLLPIGQIGDKIKGRSISINRIKTESITVVDVPPVDKKEQFLEEIQSFAKKRGISLTATPNLICAISRDQDGSRYLQRKLESALEEEINYTFQEIKSSIKDLVTDLFGNYVIQKFLEIGNINQQEKIFKVLEDNVIPYSLHMYGCRVIQKALECSSINKRIVDKIKGSVKKLVCDQNGNHVIQKCVECVETNFLVKEFEKEAVVLSKHRYGCRVIQRIFEKSAQCGVAINNIILRAQELVENQYGNYVIQHILEKGAQHHRNKIISDLSGRISDYSTHKFASNVMEKCVICATPEDRKRMLQILMEKREGQKEDTVVFVACDKFGNYVIQRLLEVLEGKEREILYQHLKKHISELRKSSYAKCIIAKLI